MSKSKAHSIVKAVELFSRFFFCVGCGSFQAFFRLKTTSLAAHFLPSLSATLISHVNRERERERRRERREEGRGCTVCAGVFYDLITHLFLAEFCSAVEADLFRTQRVTTLSAFTQCKVFLPYWEGNDNDLYFLFLEAACVMTF